MIKLDLKLGARSYPILIGSGLLNQEGLLDPWTAGRDVLIVTSSTVETLFLQPLIRLVGNARVHHLSLPDGETVKNLGTLASIYDALAAKRYGRDCVLLTLGGGVIGDIGGFAAATWQRGVDFIQIPTTLLAQVDSAVGGKTAVNHPGGKNLIGAFHQPRCVLADTDTLRTLPARELSAGLAEVVKYGLIADRELFEWLELHGDKLLARDTEALQHVILRSCQIKGQIVASDEREQGQRALLNLGHTFGHAIEHCAGYGEWLHGEAVAAGMVMAANFSARIGLLDPQVPGRLRALLQSLKLPVEPPDVDPMDFFNAMTMDKKVLAGQIRLVLLRSIGHAEITADYPSHELLDLLRAQFIR